MNLIFLPSTNLICQDLAKNTPKLQNKINGIQFLFDCSTTYQVIFPFKNNVRCRKNQQSILLQVKNKFLYGAKMKRSTLIKTGSAGIIFFAGIVALFVLGSTQPESKKEPAKAEVRSVQTQLLNFTDISLTVEGF